MSETWTPAEAEQVIVALGGGMDQIDGVQLTVAQARALAARLAEVEAERDGVSMQNDLAGEQLDALTIRSMRTQRDRAVALLREVCETSYDDLAALRGNINAACDWLESLEEGGS